MKTYLKHSVTSEFAQDLSLIQTRIWKNKGSLASTKIFAFECLNVSGLDSCSDSGLDSCSDSGLDSSSDSGLDSSSDSGLDSCSDSVLDSLVVVAGYIAKQNKHL